MDVGAYGRQSDAGIFSNSNLGDVLKVLKFSLDLPDDCPIAGVEELGPMPYCAGEECGLSTPEAFKEAVSWQRKHRNGRGITARGKAVQLLTPPC